MSRPPWGIQRQDSDDDIRQDTDTFPQNSVVNPANGNDGIDPAWLKLNILSFDGGGIRGYWSLFVLEKLMEYVAMVEESEDSTTYHSFSPKPWPANVSQVPLTDIEKQKRKKARDDEAKTRMLPQTRRYLPCHYFDYICGSSTGALISIMLGRFRMTVPDCKNEYETFGGKVFGKPRMFFTLRYGLGERFKYKASILEAVFKDVARRRNHEPDQAHGRITFPLREGLCKTFVTTRKTDTDEISDSLYLIRSYHHEKRSSPENSARPTPRSTMGPSRVGTNISSYSTRERREVTGLVDVNYEKAQVFEIWQVARAATAAPLYFEPMKVESALTRGHTLFTDGGFADTNNPVRDAKKEVEELHGKNSVSTIVSIGTARKIGERRKRPFFALLRWTKRFADQVTDPERNHADMQTEHNNCQTDEGRNFSYFPFNDPGGLDVELDEWEPKHNRFSHASSGSKTMEAIENTFNRWASNIENTNELRDCAVKLVERRRQRMNTTKWERYATGAWYECDERNCFFDSERDAFEEHLCQNHGVSSERLENRVLRCRKLWRYQPADDTDRA